MSAVVGRCGAGGAEGFLDPARRAGLLDRFRLDPAKKGRAYSEGDRQKAALSPPSPPKPSC
ncbi:ABC transporter ATP-binding protein [Streptomyces sp. PVA_94-07]|nr:ABC transporter ATP-binding protein [Streptomyces sp. PVA_94-07]